MVITLCGSSRFEPWFHMWNEALGLSGHASFGLSFYSSYHKLNDLPYTSKEMKLFDKAHIKKIEASDAILILNVFAYIGESTKNSFILASDLGKKVYFLESWGEGHGIGSTHRNEYVMAAKRYNVYGHKSVMDTSSYHSPWGDTDLMGPASVERSRNARRIKRAETLAIFGTETVE